VNAGSAPGPVAAATLPSCPADRVMPGAAMVSCSAAASAGLAAAAASWMMTTSLIPPSGVAVTARSVPGSTLG
jgi:hypothetical protein